MRTITSIEQMRRVLDEVRSSGNRIGFVPTMGYLHEGHLSLIRSARSDTDLVIMSLFVNPLQFAHNEDLGTYPRDPEGDAARASSAGCDLIFAPEVHEMYPDGQQSVLTTVSVPELACRMEGRSRPTHFAGVCTVVAKLFNIIGPCSAYFGEKDYQQLAIIRRMVGDLSFPVEVLGCPTVREADGLAMSSRNVYLDPAQREAAPVLSRALSLGAQMIADGQTDRAKVVEAMEEMIGSEPLAVLDYLDIVDASTLAPADPIHQGCRVLGAIRFSGVRLIDNMAPPGGTRSSVETADA